MISDDDDRPDLQSWPLGSEVSVNASSWFEAMTCRIDSLNAIAQSFASSIEQEAEVTRHAGSWRLLRLVGPLAAACCVVLCLVHGAVRSFRVLQRDVEAKAASATLKQHVYKQLAERWAPLSTISLDDERKGTKTMEQPAV